MGRRAFATAVAAAPPTTLRETLIEVWRQALVDERPDVELGGLRHRVGRTRSSGVRVVAFTHAGRAVDGIEQNPNTRSRWAQLARAGKKVMQFTSGGRYFANVCDGVVTRYPAWSSLGLPE